MATVTGRRLLPARKMPLNRQTARLPNRKGARNFNCRPYAILVDVIHLVYKKAKALYDKSPEPRKPFVYPHTLSPEWFLISWGDDPLDSATIELGYNYAEGKLGPLYSPGGIWGPGALSATAGSLSGGGGAGGGTGGGSSTGGSSASSSVSGRVTNTGVPMSSSREVSGRIIKEEEKYKGSLTAVALSMAKGATGT